MKISSKMERCGLSPMRKFNPYAQKTKERGIKIYHLNIGQPDVETPAPFYQALKDFDEKVVSYAYNDMQENELKIYGIQIFCAKDDALKALNLDNIKNMQIEDIKMSRFD